MARSSADDPATGLGASSELRRSVGQATERIHEIIDAAERVAGEIRSDAETEAERYLAERKREADRLARERTEALDQLTKALADSAERFKHQAEQMLADLDRVITEARAGVYRNGALAAVEAEAEAERRPEPKLAEPELRAVEPEPEPEPQPERPKAVVASYPGRAAEAEGGEQGDAGAEALLRATQMAVTGKDRDEIAAALRADFPGVDVTAIVDEILG